MSLLRFFRQLNWKYIVGEIILLFIGINLAIWFNDWNASRNTQRDKEFAIVKLKEEIRNNLEELTNAQQLNQQMVKAYNVFSKQWFKGSTSQVLATPPQMRQLETDYPGFFKAIDSIQMEKGAFLYKGQVYFELELAELTEIAWTTLNSTQVSKAFSYPCLYELESLYILQRRVKREVDKSAEALQQMDMKKLMRILNFMDQLGKSLRTQYELKLETIDDC